MTKDFGSKISSVPSDTVLGGLKGSGLSSKYTESYGDRPIVIMELG
jgi:hypothetical protein